MLKNQKMRERERKILRGRKQEVKGTVYVDSSTILIKVCDKERRNDNYRSSTE
jgi:hypothetical protein